MGQLRSVPWLAEQALMFFIVGLFPASVIAAFSLFSAGLNQRPFKTRLWKPHHWLVLTHLLFFAAAIGIGALWENPIANPGIPHHADPVARFYLDVVTYGSLVSCAFWIWRMKGFRWYAASLMALA